MAANAESSQPDGRGPATGARTGSRGRRLAVLGGADASLLNQVPSESGRFVQMFFVLVSTAAVSGVSMVFALTNGVHVALWVAVPLAVIWSLIIFNLDRFLTSTIKSTRNVGSLVLLALPRVLMAVVIGIVVAEPLVLQVFQSDINQEMDRANLRSSESGSDLVDSGPLKAAVDDASQRLDELESQAATGAVVGAATESAAVADARSAVTRLTEQVSAQDDVVSKALALFQCEDKGPAVAGNVEGCSGRAGGGPSTDAALNALNAARAQQASLNQQLQAANETLATAEQLSADAVAGSADQLRREAADQLPAARAEYDRAFADYNDRRLENENTNSEATGMLNQISALDQLSKREPTLLWAHIMIGSLFFLIELLPILVKSLTSYGDKTPYEEVADLQKRSLIDAAKVRRNDERWSLEERSKMRREVEQDMLGHELRLGRMSNEHVANEMTAVLNAALSDWSRRVASTLQATKPPTAS